MLGVYRLIGPRSQVDGALANLSAGMAVTVQIKTRLTFGLCLICFRRWHVTFMRVCTSDKLLSL